MGQDRKKKQQKKSQKVAKYRAKKVEHRKHHSGAPRSLRGAFQAPVHECWEASHLFSHDRGIGSVLITRQTSGHQILLGVFLLDVFCLGVKNAFVKLMSKEEYRAQLQQLQTNEGLKATSPECARKLIEDAEAYARELGFTPHKDYQKAKNIFGEIDTAECSRTFEFGRDGKPLYFAGPYDSQAFQQRIIKTLTEKLGPEGFDYIMPIGAPPADFFD